MILESVKHGPLIWPTTKENGVTRPRKYSELTHAEAIKADCDVKATNIILQGLPPEVHNPNNIDKNMINQSVQAMPPSEQSSVVNHSETEITSDRNIIPYSQYVHETQQAAVQNSNSSAQQDTLILSVIDQLKTQVINCTKINLDNKNINDTLTAELERYKEKVKVLKEGQHVREQGLIITALKDELTKLKGKSLVDNVVTTHTIALEMLKIGIKPSTSASGLQPSGNTKKDKIQRPPSSTQKNKVEAHPKTVKSSLKNKNCAVKPKKTAIVQHSKLNANSKLISVKFNGCMLSNNHDLYVLNVVNDVNARPKSISVKKTSKRKVWKPTGKVFTKTGYTWRLTGRTFTIVGNTCPLTRITTTTEVHPRKPIVLETDTPKPVVILVDSRKLRKSKTSIPCLRSKDEASDFIIKFLKMIQLWLKAPVRRIKTDNGTKFVNQTLREYYEKVGISHETSVAHSLQQNEAVATACYTQNCSIIRLRNGKTPYELLHDKLHDLSFFHVFGALCYPTNDSEKLEKLQPKADIVASANRLMIMKCNHQLSCTLKSNEPTLQVVLDALKLTPFYKAFHITANVPKIYMQEFWSTISIHHTLLHFKMNDKSHTLNLENFKDMLQICPKLLGQKCEDPPFEEEILSFIRDLGHTREIKDTQIYDAILPDELTNQEMLDSKAYKEYYAVASEAEPPKAKKYKKKADEPVTPSKSKSAPAAKGTRLKTPAKVTGTNRGAGIRSEVPDVTSVI
uniref:Retrovirus-related Pol polyprotein from transposon TNT 1-94 n=1 Tax=Tanacetum cinerariifolium TaxID=118510 RepID=A0A6L2MKE2_TANCI|nr:retrovirus-related Pol polyprotein from transposon TNT 1-94 [Tanacetum cinerariifolium]